MIRRMNTTRSSRGWKNVDTRLASIESEAGDILTDTHVVVSFNNQGRVSKRDNGSLGSCPRFVGGQQVPSDMHKVLWGRVTNPSQLETKGIASSHCRPRFSKFRVVGYFRSASVSAIQAGRKLKANKQKLAL